MIVNNDGSIKNILYHSKVVLLETIPFRYLLWVEEYLKGDNLMIFCGVKVFTL
jgi:hypothetical protein